MCGSLKAAKIEHSDLQNCPEMLIYMTKNMPVYKKLTGDPKDFRQICGISTAYRL